MTELINAFQMAQRQFDHVAGSSSRPQVAEILRWPAREFKFEIPVRMDDGSMRLFFATGCSTTTRAARTRWHPLPPSETLDTVRAWRCG